MWILTEGDRYERVVVIRVQGWVLFRVRIHGSGSYRVVVFTDNSFSDPRPVNTSETKHMYRQVSASTGSIPLCSVVAF